MIDIALPPKFLFTKLEANVTTTFASIKKQVYSNTVLLIGNRTLIVPIPQYGYFFFLFTSNLGLFNT